MAIKKYVAISYCFAFLSVYFCSMAYALLSTSINNSFEEDVLPQTVAMNSTVSAISSMSNWSGLLVTVGFVALILTILFIIFSSKAMGAAL